MTAVFGQQLFQLGSQGAPSVSFIGDTGTGIFSSATSRIDFSTNSTTRMFVSAFQVGSTVPFRGPDGAVGTPTFTFSNENTTGFYLIGAGVLGAAIQGTLLWQLSAGDLVLTPPLALLLQAAPGTPAAGVRVYAKTGFAGKVYSKGTDGVEYDLTATGASAPALGDFMAMGV